MNSFLRANAELSKFSRNYMQLKNNLPIRPSEMGVLNIIVQTPGPHTSVMLAEMLGVSKPMIAAHIAVLVHQGYVVKQQSPEDKRAFYILPTEKARRLVASAQKETDAQLERMIQHMGQSDFDMLVRLAARANQMLEISLWT